MKGSDSGFCFGFLILYQENCRLFDEKFSLKNQDRHDADENGRIGNVKDRTEKKKIVSSHNGHPYRPIEPDQREKKHIDYLTVEPPGRGIKGGIIEKHSIKCAVNDIADGTAQDQ